PVARRQLAASQGVRERLLLEGARAEAVRGIERDDAPLAVHADGVAQAFDLADGADAAERAERLPGRIHLERPAYREQPNVAARGARVLDAIADEQRRAPVVAEGERGRREREPVGAPYRRRDGQAAPMERLPGLGVRPRH